MRPAIAAAAVCSALCTVLATGLTTVGPAAAAAAPAAAATATTPGDADAARALSRLRDDADQPLRVHGDGSGRVTFVGTRTGDTIDNPSVAPHDDAVTVARRDLDRYGDALGLADGDRGMHTLSRKRAVTGDTVVRLQQTVDGLPVLGGQVVVSVDGNGGTSSILSTTSTATRASRARVGRADAAATAVALTARKQHRPASSLRATDGSLAVFDPAAFGAVTDTGVRTVRQFEVTNGSDVREQVLVDAVTGRVILNVDDVQTLNRKVCDRANTRGDQTPCSAGVARAEGDSAVSSPADVNKAYDLSGEVSDFYQQIGGLDLTELIGFGTSGSRTLGSTVRYCEPSSAGSSCPYDNAFWNGTQMFYGAGYAGADDVVGHEMTHGVISRYSNLFYFFQSGAINESLADIMGEIVDHRYGSDAGNNSSWTVGEDLPIGAIRSLSTPTADDQPDKMTSTKYDADLSLSDNGGVHTDSGVGNKTAYLISQGGSFNGVTVQGIDGSDGALTKTAKLYLDVIEKLSSGSDYADLGRQLTQSCSDFVTAGTAGFTNADCTNVGLAVQATELAKQPTVANAAEPTDAPAGCPSGQTEHVLFDDENANPATEFTAGSLWTRAPGSVNGFPADSNATSGQASWFGLDPDPSLGDAASASLTLAHAVTVPTGGKTYMRFNHWYAFDYDPSHSPRIYYDGGLVKVDNTADTAGAQQASGLPWVNGPTRAVRGSGSTAQTGFGGVSNGYTASRVDLSSYAGKTIKPQFQVVGDQMYQIEGWYLDDIEIYTCGEELANKPAGVTTTGGLNQATVSWTPPAYGGDGISGYRVTGTGGLTRDLPATARSTTFTGLKSSTSYTFTVRALNQESAGGATASVTATGTKFSSLAVARTGQTQTKVTGRLLNGSSAGLGGKVVQVQRKASNGTWSTVAKPKTDSGGHLSATLSGRSTADYRLLFPGGSGLIGGTSGAKHL